MTTKKQMGGKQNKTRRNRLSVNSPLNCNPTIDGNSVVRGSCFPNKVLTLLKQSYNESNPDNQITSEKPRLIWNNITI